MVSNYSEYMEAISARVKERLDSTSLYQFKGTVSKLLGLTVEVKLPGLKIGDLCYIETNDGKKKPAEVAAFKGEVAQLLLLLDGAGIGQGSLVTSTGRPIVVVNDLCSLYVVATSVDAYART